MLISAESSVTHLWSARKSDDDQEMVERKTLCRDLLWERACCSMADTLRSCERTLRSSMTAYSSSTRRPEFGRSGRPLLSFSRSVLVSPRRPVMPSYGRPAKTATQSSMFIYSSSPAARVFLALCASQPRRPVRQLLLRA